MSALSQQNPFDELISDCNDDPSQIQDRYEAHRLTRNTQQSASLLSPDFPGWQTDEILRKLHIQATQSDGNSETRFVDARNSLCFYARPPQHIRELVAEIQDEIRTVAPNVWLTPPSFLHMTVLDVASSRTPSEIAAIVSHLEQSGAVPELANYTFDHRARLVNPIVSYDASAMALSFVPASGEDITWDRNVKDDEYTYHHLRRDLYTGVEATGLQLKPRYIVPSAHITIARFITQDDLQLQNPRPDGGSSVDRGRITALVKKIEQINQKIKEKYWSREDQSMFSKAEWLVGHETGLELCRGPCWYGEGEKVFTGKGFDLIAN